MTGIPRDPHGEAQRKRDLIIVGGGIYGVMLLLEAGRRRLSALLLERDDFGGATTFNSLRIVHGGLRYLQSADLRRFFDSVAERQWLLQEFPDLVEPLRCLMPLYGRGIRRPSILRWALRANDALCSLRIRGNTGARRLPGGQVIDARETATIFPEVQRSGLLGAAVWSDAVVPDSQRLVIEALRTACGWGGAALNYLEALDLLVERGRVTGIAGVDRANRTRHEFNAEAVVNAAGPWCRELAARFDSDYPVLFEPSLAWNVLFDRPALSDHALALNPNRGRGHTYFITPWKGRLMAGTGHAPWRGDTNDPQPSRPQITEFIADLNRCVPGLGLSDSEVVRIFPGLLPARGPETASLATREVLIDHGKAGGPGGFFSVSGVKLTTARLVAEKALERLFPNHRLADMQSASTRRTPVPEECWRLDARALAGKPLNGPAADSIRRLASEESVLHLDDLVLRRTTLWERPVAALAAAQVLCELLGFGESLHRQEVARLRRSLERPG